MTPELFGVWFLIAWWTAAAGCVAYFFAAHLVVFLRGASNLFSGRIRFD